MTTTTRQSCSCGSCSAILLHLPLFSRVGWGDDESAQDCAYYVEGGVSYDYTPVAYEGVENGGDEHPNERGAASTGVEDSQRRTLVAPFHHGGHQGRQWDEPSQEHAKDHAEYDRDDIAARKQRSEEPQRHGYRTADATKPGDRPPPAEAVAKDPEKEIGTDV